MMNAAILYNKSWVCYSVYFLFLNFSILIIAPQSQITCTDVLWLVFVWIYSVAVVCICVVKLLCLLLCGVFTNLVDVQCYLS